ncbi:MAG: protein GlxC [Gammaproteobacteria bacterium]|nr:protein GlxC [Gammaproteobacteria bacterium]NNM01816.1 protein GlxC [Gammaproteobacteria bacterium]
MSATYDLAEQPVRDLNAFLHGFAENENGPKVTVSNPRGLHNIAVGAMAPLDITIDGHVGYYCAGMNQRASITIDGNAGPGVAENMMSGTVRITGNASQYAGATAHGGLLVIEGDSSSRCGISMKGVDIVVHGDVGHMSAFMAQKGRLVICGDAGDALGDSLYEARLYVRGKVASLGADCVEKPLRDEHVKELAELIEQAGVKDARPEDFRRYGSARALYNFQVDNIDAY